MHEMTGGNPAPNLEKPNRDLFDGISESAGPRLATFKGGVIHAVQPPGSQRYKYRSHFAKVMLAPSAGIVVDRGGGDEAYSYDAAIGSIVVKPAGQECVASWSHTKEYVGIAIETEYLQHLAVEECDSADVELQPPPSGTVDVHALQLAEIVKAELARDSTVNELYVDSLITIFGIHLLRNYTRATKPLTRWKGGLSIRSAQRVREFIQANFRRKLPVVELASVAGLSERHFIQAFARTFGKPPHQFVLDLRLTFAQELLVKGDLTIAEVPHISGFSSQSHLTAVMRKYRRVTPMRIRQGN